MTRFILPLLAFVMALPALAQSGTEAAKVDGKAFAREAARAAQQAASTSPDASRIPNFAGTPPQSGYFDDPDRMSREAASATTSNEAYRAMRASIASISTPWLRARKRSTRIRSPIRAA